MRKQIWTFLGLVGAKWASLVTGSFSALLVLLGLGINIAGALGVKSTADSIVQLGTWILAAICGGYATFSVWHREHTAKEALESRLTPKFAVSYDPAKPQCRSVSTFTDQFGRNPKDAMCFRLEVENKSAETVLDCEGHLTEIFYEGERPELAPMNLTWVASVPGVTGIDIRSLIRRYLDIVVIDSDNHIRISSLGWPNNKQDFFKRFGTYNFEVAISARNGATTQLICFRLVFDGNWQTSTIEPIR